MNVTVKEEENMTIKKFVDILASNLMTISMKVVVSSDTVATSMKRTNTAINITR